MVNYETTWVKQPGCLRHLYSSTKMVMTKPSIGWWSVPWSCVDIAERKKSERCKGDISCAKVAVETEDMPRKHILYNGLKQRSRSNYNQTIIRDRKLWGANWQAKVLVSTFSIRVWVWHYLCHSFSFLKYSIMISFCIHFSYPMRPGNFRRPLCNLYRSMG